MTESEVRHDVEAFHVFFVRWITGSYDEPASVFEREVEGRLAEGFTYVFPSGARLSRAEICEGLRKGWATNPAFEIDVEDVRVVDEQSGLVVATYIERQRGAINSEPTNARHSTAVLRRSETAPNGFAWVHLHETALPSPS